MGRGTNVSGGATGISTEALGASPVLRNVMAVIVATTATSQGWKNALISSDPVIRSQSGPCADKGLHDELRLELTSGRQRREHVVRRFGRKPGSKRHVDSIDRLAQYVDDLPFYRHIRRRRDVVDTRRVRGAVRLRVTRVGGTTFAG